MRKESVILILCAIALVCAVNDGFWLVETAQGASTIIVPDDYSTIQEAANNAVEGDVIFVRSGIYFEHVVINKTLSLVGENSMTTIIDGNRTGVVINVTQNWVIVSGLTIRRSGSMYWENAGILLGNVENCSISENILTENSFAGLELNYSRRCSISGNRFLNNGGVGITLVGGSSNVLSRNSFTENGWSAVTLNDGANNNEISENNMTSNNQAVTGHCINLYRSNNNSIQKNRITSDDNGIRFEYWSNFNTISQNNITNNTQSGVSVETYSDNNTISGNTLTGGRFGVAVNSSRYVEICNNTIAHNYGSGWDAGVILDSAGHTLIHGNEITDNWRGIQLTYSSPNVSIYGNNVTGNEFGIRVFGGGSSFLNVSGNLVANNRGYGVAVTGIGGESNYAFISRNVIVNNIDGIALGQGSSYNTVIQNNISWNEYGIGMEYSTQNLICSNNIVDNIQQVSIVPGSVNAWNGSYPSGGNYWSDYSGADQFSGPYQNMTGSDGVGDAPYVIDANNVDHFPLMIPYNPSPIGGDLNADGTVDIFDIVIVALEFGHPPPPIEDERADVNKDGIVDIFDIAIVAIHFGETSF